MPSVRGMFFWFGALGPAWPLLGLAWGWPGLAELGRAWPGLAEPGWVSVLKTNISFSIRLPSELLT